MRKIADLQHTEQEGHNSMVENSAVPHVGEGFRERASNTSSLTLTEGRVAPSSLSPRQQARLAGTARRQDRAALNIRRVAKAVYWTYRGANISDAIKAAGVPEKTWYEWLQAFRTGQYPDGSPVSPSQMAFAARLTDAFTRAQGLCAIRMQQTLTRASQTSVGTLDWRAAHEHLKHAEATRKRWHEHRELKIEHAGQVDHEHRLIAQMPLEDVIELASPEFRELLPPPVQEGAEERQP